MLTVSLNHQDYPLRYESNRDRQKKIMFVLEQHLWYLHLINHHKYHMPHQRLLRFLLRIIGSIRIGSIKDCLSLKRIPGQTTLTISKMQGRRCRRYSTVKRLTRLFVSRRLNQNSLPSLKRPKMLSTTGGILLRTILMLFWIRQPGISWLKRPQYSQDFKG